MWVSHAWKLSIRVCPCSRKGIGNLLEQRDPDDREGVICERCNDDPKQVQPEHTEKDQEESRASTRVSAVGVKGEHHSRA